MANVNPMDLQRRGTCTICLSFEEPMPGEPAVYLTVTRPDGTMLERIGVCKTCLSTGQIVDALNALDLTINID